VFAPIAGTGNTAQSLVGEDRATLREALRHLHHSALLLEPFADQVSRRPARLLTSLKPPPLDTTGSQP
jgi:ABC-type transporter Mla subunit MlaD